MAEFTPGLFHRPCHPRPIVERLPHIRTRFDDDGDLTLVVGLGAGQERFIVDSRAMARASAVFKAMLFGPYKEAKPQDGSAWSVELPEDEPQGLEVLLSIIHAKFTIAMPRTRLSDKLACSVCVIADKYLMMNLLLPFIGQWISYKEAFGTGWLLSPSEAQQRLVIASFLGDGRVFWRAIGNYACFSYIVEGQLVRRVHATLQDITKLGHSPTPPMFSGRTTLAQMTFYSIGNPPLPQAISRHLAMTPLDCTGVIVKMRLRLIKKLLLWANNVVKRLGCDQSPHNHICDYARDDCPKALLVKLEKRWASKGVWPLPTADEWQGTFPELWTNLCSGPTPKHVHRQKRPRKSCTLKGKIPGPLSPDWGVYDWVKMRMVVADEVEGIESFLLKQATKLGLHDPVVPFPSGPYRLPRHRFFS